jgi:hypothetical protein
MSVSKVLERWAIVAAFLVAIVACATACGNARTDGDLSAMDDDLVRSQKIVKMLGDGYPELTELLESTGEPKTYAIPSLTSALNIYASGEDEGKIGFATDMVPQGVAVTERYIIVSAYCESKDFHSVLWVLDRRNRDYIKTVVLDGTDHVGGIAYDFDHRLLWVAATTDDGRAAAGCLSMDRIDAYDFDDNNACLDYERVYALEGIERTSFVALFENALYAGCFYPKKAGVLCCYALDEDGYPTPVEENSRDAIPKHTVSIPSEIQGMTFVQDMIVLSRSYGPHDARLMVYEYTDVYDLSDLTDNNCLYSGVLPPYLEQICADGNDLYLVFESSAERYRSRKGSLPIDCVLRIDVSDFYETHVSTTSARKG